MKLKTLRVNELYRLSYYLREQAIRMVYQAKTGHAAPACSIAELLSVLYFEKLNVDPQNPKWEDRDRFVLSKGHACPIYYATLAKRGFFDEDILNTYRGLDSKLPGHPDMRKTPGVDMTTGSLGNGVSVALGMAMICKRDKHKNFVYVITGDGELNEGIIWESFMAGEHYHLDNLIVIVDNNGLQSGGNIKDVMNIYPLEDKFKAFGWDVCTIDGHNVQEISDAIDAAKVRNGKPHAIIAKTVKGKGVSFMEGQFLWHMKAPNDQEYEIAIKELRQEAAKYE